MGTIDTLKEQATPGTPLFLFDCTLSAGPARSFSTHAVTYNGTTYSARVVKHNLFELRATSDQGIDSLSRVSITLANADSLFSEIERNTGWKGAQLTIQFVFMDLESGTALSESRVVFRGSANPPEESTESTFRLSFSNRLNLQRIFLPEIHIQRRCPWTFPADANQRKEALDGGAAGGFSPFYRCGYSADAAGGVGNLNGGAAYTACDYSRAQCQQRGMFDHDAAGRATGRFGGVEFVPPSALVRSYGESGSHLSPVLDNQARYNDFVPLVYGTGWFNPPLVFARNDGNLTRMELLLSAGEIQGVLKVIVNNVEIPAAVAGANMTATGWYSLVSRGTRNGAFNLNFTDGAGNPLGDPYGSMACLSVVAPNRISSAQSFPTVSVLIQGMKLARYDTAGKYLDTVFANNPSWVLLNLLQRSGWKPGEIDLRSFARAAEVCGTPVAAKDLHGNAVMVPQFQCNLILNNRRSAADVIRGVRNGSGLYLVLSEGGLLRVQAEGTLAQQQAAKAPGGNSTAALAGGWPAYEFGDNALSGILRKGDGSSTFRVFSRSSADAPNRMTAEFQDEFNEYQQDSLSIVDAGDQINSGQEISASLTALGLANFNQASRVMTLQLNKSVRGNTYIEFETSVKSLGLNPGDLIGVTYSREGWTRQPFRIVRIAPGANFRTALITAQIHDDAWYGAGAGLGGSGSGRQPGWRGGLPRPLVGTAVDASGRPQFGIAETDAQNADGSYTANLSAEFRVPGKAAPSGAGIPLVGLNAGIGFSGGTLAGAQTLYYAVSGVDAGGGETPLSFTVTANVPAGTNTNTVTLQSLSFSQGTAGFNVYRGTTPQQLYRIATSVPAAAQFVDNGNAAQTLGPPDPNFDHANFYWRFEIQPEAPADIFSATTIGNSVLQMLANEHRSQLVRISKGTGSGQERQIAGNTATVLTLGTPWSAVPDATSAFVVTEAAWHFGSTGSASPVSFDVPNRPGAIVEVSGRAANVQNDETDASLSPLTAWRIGGAGTMGDADVPPQPTFALATSGEGTVEALGVAFANLTNTRTVTAGTLVLSYWDELRSPSTIALASAVGAADAAIALTAAGSGRLNSLVQIDAEVMVVRTVGTGGTSYTITRGAYGTSAAAHAAAAPVYDLTAKTYILPFVPNFFGSPASGSYSHPLPLADKRIAASDFFVTNVRGNSGVIRSSYTNTADLGLRTLSGGQLSIQIEGHLAIQTNAAPPLVMENTRSVRDVFAVVKAAPGGSPIQLRVTQNGSAYCLLTIPVGQTVSNIVDGFALGPLAAKARIGLDIVSVTQTAGTTPGSDLTVTIRF